MPLSPVPTAITSGQVTVANTIITCTLPTYAVGDCLILNANNAQTTFTLSAPITSFTVVAGGTGNRCQALALVPNGAGQTTFTVTGASAVWTWVILNYSGASLTALPTTSLNSAVTAYGSVTTTPVPVPEVNSNFVATGNEVLVSAVGVNGTTTWTTTGSTQFHTTANSAAMMINAINLTLGGLTGVAASMTRAAGTLNQTAIGFILQPAPLGAINLLSNPSFELGATLATSWTDEHTTATEATYSLTATGATDGALAQKMVYSGVVGDGGTAKTEIYQAPITATPGTYLTFTVWLSGSLTSLYGLIGIEAFTSGSVYISETDANFLTLTGTPTLYTVSYLCPPGTDHVAAFLQVPSIGSGASLSITMDQATLTTGPAPVLLLGTPHIEPTDGTFTGSDPSADVGEPDYLNRDIGIPDGTT